VQAAISALNYFNGLPELPRAYFISPARNANMLDFLQYTFGFQVCINRFLFGVNFHVKIGLVLSVILMFSGS
jgi:hypothetical protein